MSGAAKLNSTSPCATSAAEGGIIGDEQRIRRREDLRLGVPPATRAGGVDRPLQRHQKTKPPERGPCPSVTRVLRFEAVSARRRAYHSRNSSAIGRPMNQVQLHDHQDDAERP